MPVRIGIIEDTLLHGGTQMWSVEAALLLRLRCGGHGDLPRGKMGGSTVP